MSRNPIERYIWLIDTLRQRGRLTRRQISDLWSRTPFSKNGEGICRRTLYNYKNAIASLFEIDIAYDPVTYEYYIKEPEKKESRFTDWLLNAASVSETLTTSRDLSDRILLEDVPSGRGRLPLVIAALRNSSRLVFDYHNYTRSRPTVDIEFEPYLLRIFRQRWYVVGRNIKEQRVKTYALDRMTDITDTGIPFAMPADFDPETYFRYSFGIVVINSRPRDITIRTDHHYAKYLDALPLHASQQKTVHDSYCLFRYKMLITDDLVQELLGLGSRIVVEEPKELRVKIREELRKTLAAYNDSMTFASVRTGSSQLPITDLDAMADLRHNIRNKKKTADKQ